jgi:hypothetical protein
VPLLSIDPRELAVLATSPQGAPIVEATRAGYQRALLKFKDVGCCEVLGYQVAMGLQVPVASARGFCCHRASTCLGQPSGEYRIGVLIEELKPFEVVADWKDAASKAPDAIVRALQLTLLGRYEWPELAMTARGIVVFDLERIFPPWSPERVDGQSWYDVGSEIHEQVQEYRETSGPWISEVISFAAQVGLLDRMKDHLAASAQLTRNQLLSIFDLQPHPLASLVTQLAADAAARRFREAAELALTPRGGR